MRLPLTILLTACQASASISHIYYGGVSAGSNNGTSCSNQYAYSDVTNGFNVSGKWGAGATQIGSDTVVHLCGTITVSGGTTTALTTQAAGTSGHPITIQFETGSVLTAGAWPATGAINVAHDYITVDGNTLGGTIQATASGAGLTFNGVSTAIRVNNASHVDVKNLNMINLFVRTGGSSDIACDAFSNGCGRVVLVTGTSSFFRGFGNLIHDGAVGFEMDYQTSATNSNWEIYSNTIYNCEHGLNVIQGSGNGVLNTVLIHDNNIYDGANWQDPSDNFHLDGMLISTSNTANTITGLQIYNNWVHGDWGTSSHVTAYIFLSFDPGNTMSNVLIYNNFLNPTAGQSTANGLLYFQGGTSPSVYNNTFVQTSQSGYAAAFGNVVGQTGISIENNVFSGFDQQIRLENSSTITVSNKNLFYNYSTGFYYNGTGALTFSGWQGLGFDANSVNGSDPLVSTPGGTIASGSPARNAGANLTSLSITALDSDKAGVLRPSVAAWDIGAYQFAGAGGGGLNGKITGGVVQ